MLRYHCVGVSLLDLCRAAYGFAQGIVSIFAPAWCLAVPARTARAAGSIEAEAGEAVIYGMAQ